MSGIPMATDSITDTLATAYTISTTTTSTNRQTPTATYVDSAATSTVETVTTPAISPPSADLLLEDSNPGFDTPALDKQRHHVTNRGNPNVSFKTP